MSSANGRATFRTPNRPAPPAGGPPTCTAVNTSSASLPSGMRDTGTSGSPSPSARPGSARSPYTSSLQTTKSSASPWEAGRLARSAWSSTSSRWAGTTS